jgi:hypothetical protein
VADAGLSAEVRRGVSVIQPCEPLSYFPSLPENVLQDTTQIGIQSAMSGLELVVLTLVPVDDLAEELGSAGRDVRYIGNDMAGFSQVSYTAHESVFLSIHAKAPRHAYHCRFSVWFNQVLRKA